MPSIRWKDNNWEHPDLEDAHGNSEIVEILTGMVKGHIPDAMDQVDRACNKWNQKIRERLRDETGFKLTRGDKRVTIGVELAHGLPKALQNVLQSYDPLLVELLLHRQLFSDATVGVNVANNQLDRITQVLRKGTPTPRETESFRDVVDLLTKLNIELATKELPKTILRINHDVLGAYYYRAAKVKLFWLPIALLAMSGGFAIEALTFVVLAHELAHAYTHLGMDIDGHDWNTSDFASADLELVEGLAQYYTEIICDHVAEQLPEAKACFENMLAGQSACYTAYRNWNQCASGEHMRAFLIYESKRDQHPVHLRYRSDAQ